jgi:septal ring factor EnvC (AmiA/AmiB activator)
LTVTRESRDKLVEKLRAVLGPDNSDTLIRMLPMDPSALATKEDLESLETRIATKVDLEEIRADLAGVKTDLAGVKTDLTGVKTDLTGVKTDLTGVKTDLAGVKTDLLGVNREIGGIKGDIARLDGRMEKFEDRLWDLHEAIRAQARVYVTAIIGGMIGLAGVLTAVSRLG